MIQPGATLTLDIDKPAAGGRMLARHEGQVVLVSNAIPDERVAARVERASKGLAFADAIEILTPSPDRRSAADWRCGGNLLAHVAYDRQLGLKGEIIRDAFARIAKAPLAEAPAMIGSPEQGYRMRARLHASDGRFGFFREGTHQLCDPAVTGQLLPSTIAWVREVEARVPAASARSIRGLEISEDIAGGQRAAWLDSSDDASWFRPLAGPDRIVERLDVSEAAAVVLQRSARSFFQGNRFLLEQMVRHVIAQVPDGPVVDLYAGVGLFGLALAARGATVTLVEGDHSSGRDLEANASAYPNRVRVSRASVEAFLPHAPRTAFVIDPPRTGLSKAAISELMRIGPPAITYVSCDPATLARDARILLDAGYEPGPVTGFDLFPNTAHVESVVTFSR